MHGELSGVVVCGVIIPKSTYLVLSPTHKVHHNPHHHHPMHQHTHTLCQTQFPDPKYVLHIVAHSCYHIHSSIFFLFMQFATAQLVFHFGNISIFKQQHIVERFKLQIVAIASNDLSISLCKTMQAEAGGCKTSYLIISRPS